MKEDVYNKIDVYLKENKKMTIATVNTEGQAIAHTVQYVSEGNTVFFFTKPTQRKVVNIQNNPQVGYTVDRDYEDWSKIQGVQMLGKARVLNEDDEIDRSFKLFGEKFPHLAAIGKAFLEHHVIIEVKPVLGRFLDNTVQFGYFEETTY